MVNFKFGWHPRFSIHETQNGDALFLGDREQFLLGASEYLALNAVIEAHGGVADYVFESEDIAEQVDRVERIDTLVADARLLKEGDAVADYFLPDFDKPIGAADSGGRSYYQLSCKIDGRLLLERLVESGLPESIVPVIVDDYLDVRLPALSRELQRQGRQWLLVRPGGRLAMIGPLFGKPEAETPCYHCLYSRLVLNSPVREWCRRRAGHEGQPAVPVYHDPESVQNSIDNFAEYYLPYLCSETNPEPRLYTVDGGRADEPVGQFHNLSRRPQCPACGDAGLFAAYNDMPLDLASAGKDSDIDGGYRSLSREQTLANINKLISPVTGIITEITEVTDSGDADEMAIYQAAYFQNAFNDKSLSADTFVQLSLGKGVSKNQAMSSALGEALERQAAQFNGEERFTFAAPAQLDRRAYLPQQLAAFSDAQYRGFEAYNEVTLANPQWVKPYHESTAMHWVRGWSLTESEQVYFPAAFCFANTPCDDHVYSLYTHNGNSAGNSEEEAVLQGALEVIERDAVAIWWYNQIPRPEIALEVVPEQSRRIVENTLTAEWDYWLLDISGDIGVVSAVAVGRHKESGQLVLGFGTHLDVAVACQRALTEMYQLITIKDKVTGPFDFSLIPPHPFIFPRRNTEKHTLSDYSVIGGNTIRDDILYLIEILKREALELCVVNYSRPDINLKTLKVIVPGLCHFWPQLANRRLYEVPVRLGWLSKPLSEDELNPLDLYL